VIAVPDPSFSDAASALLPIAHLGHYTALLYAAPVLALLAWAGFARLKRWIRGRRGGSGS